MSYYLTSRSSIYSSLNVAFVALLALTLACLPTRDESTHSALESARDQVHSLYDTFTGTQVDEARIDTVRATLAALRASQVDKGDGNVLMVRQVEAIQQMFEKHIAERKRRRWSGVNKNNKKELIGLAFQTAIATENEKNASE